MRFDGLNISELIKVCQNTKGSLKRFFLKDVNRYLYHRIENKEWCSEEEIRDLELFVQELLRKFWDTQEKAKLRKLLKRINELIIYSKEELDRINRVEFKNLKRDVSNVKNHSYMLVLLKELLRELEKENVSCERVINKIGKLDKELNIYISDSLFELFKRLIDWIDKHEEELFGKRMFPKRKVLRNKIISLKERIKKFEDTDIKIKRSLESGELDLRCEEWINRRSISFSREKLDIVRERVITIDAYNASSLEGAFSIRRDKGFYNFDVYVTDVPTFLKDNRDIAKRAYERGTSISIENYKGKKNIHLDMLPAFLDENYLSLRKDKMRNVIDFNFIVKDDGEIESVYVSRKSLSVTDSLDYNRAREIFFSKNGNSKARWDLLVYKEMIEKIIKKTKYPYLQEINVERLNDLVSFSSILVNYYVGDEADFVIYRDGCYVKKGEDSCYTHSVTPLRRFVSNINLAFLLNQKGEVSFSDKDLNYVERNIDEILAHLNRQDELSRFVDKYPEMVKKYVK